MRARARRPRFRVSSVKALSVEGSAETRLWVLPILKLAAGCGVSAASREKSSGQSVDGDTACGARARPRLAGKWRLRSLPNPAGARLGRRLC